MSEEVDLLAAPGWVEPRLQAEFPHLGLDWVTVEVRRRDSPPELEGRLRALSDRYRGATVVALRQRPVAHAYRAFFRAIGLDPDVARIPLESAAVERLMHGRFVSRGLLADALLVALVETGVGVWALDADLVDVGGLGIRTTVDGERVGEAFLLGGRLVVADARTAHGVLFDEVVAGHGPTRDSRRAMVFAVRVEGVPQIHVEEALWMCVEAIAGA